MDSRESGVAEWMAREKSQAIPKVQPLTAPIVFVPASYTPSGAEDPFSVNKLARVFTQNTKKNNSNLIAVHADRRKEALEAYPLEDLHAVVGAALAERGLPFLDLLEVYRAARRNGAVEINADPLHPNREGYGLAAKAVEEALRRGGKLEGRGRK